MMMLHGIGTDIVNISRVANLAQRYNGRFLRKFLHQEEIREYEKLRRSHPSRAGSYLASRWSAKEALTKAFGVGRFLFPDVKVDRTPSGAPVLTLYGTARDLALDLGISQTMISISHESEYAVSFVTALKSTPSIPEPLTVRHQPAMHSTSVARSPTSISPDAHAWLVASGISSSQIPPISSPPPMIGLQSSSSVDEGFSVFDELYESGFDKPK